MTDIHSCSYFCERPACIKVQRDKMREKIWVGLTDEEQRVFFIEPSKPN